MAEQTVCKFRVDEIRTTMGSRRVKNLDGSPKLDERNYQVHEPCEMRTVVMSPVYKGEEGSENTKFWDASPSGKFELGCINLDAAKIFGIGDEVLITLSVVKKCVLPGTEK